MGIHVRWPLEASERKPATLRGKGLSAYGGLGERFHFWLGASGRRYVCSVFAAADQAIEGLIFPMLS